MKIVCNEVSEITDNSSKQKFNEYIENTHFSVDTKDVICKMFGISQSSKKEDDITICLEDFKEIIGYGDEILFGVGESSDGSVSEAIKLAIQNTSLSISSLDRVAGFLIHFTVHPNLSVLNIAEAMEIIYENAHDEASIVWGTTTNELLGKDDIQVAILFTGFGQAISYATKAANNVRHKS